MDKPNTDFEAVFNKFTSRLLEIRPNIVLEPYHSQIIAAHNQSLEAAEQKGRYECSCSLTAKTPIEMIDHSIARGHAIAGYTLQALPNGEETE